MKLQRILNICTWLIITVATLILLRTGSRIFVGDWFPVNTSSMSPTIVPGDKIWVNKLIFGARIYKNLDFFDGKPLQTFRVKGWRKIRRGDVVVFNAPIHQSGPDSIAFRIDYVYVKRCAGLPGDTLYIPKSATFSRPQDTIFTTHRQKYTGTIFVPKKGDTLCLDRADWELYHTVVAYETNGIIPEKFHVFQNNYYFMCGDNTLQSHDSRNFGFVPEEFIIGISKRVLFNNKKGWKQQFAGRRVLRRLK